MAELLVELVNGGRARSYENGMVIAVKEDGSFWGTHENPDRWVEAGNKLEDWPNKGRFAFIKAPGPASDYLPLLERKVRRAVRGDPEFDAPDDADREVYEKERRLKLDLTLLTPVLRDVDARHTYLTKPTFEDT